MKRKAVYFTGGGVEVREENVAAPGAGEALVVTELSAISAGTELLFLRGEAPRGITLDDGLGSLRGTLRYPLKYGYAAVGRVADTGPGVAGEWVGRRVFGFYPHESCFVAPVDELYPLPPDMEAEAALFFPNMETAVTLVADGAPLLGESVAVFGQGVVGLLVTALLARFPLGKLVTLDPLERRRTASVGMGAQAALNPDPEGVAALHSMLADDIYSGADLAYELSGRPEALDVAVGATGFHGRVIVGSWYGTKPVEMGLGGKFHRGRIRLISSQVSTVSPELSGRFNKARVRQAAWRMVGNVRPERLVTHRFGVEQAVEAYGLLDERPEEAIQVVLTY